MSSVYKEFGNPLAGFPVLVQMPVLLPCLPPARFTVFDKLHCQPANLPLHKLNKFNPKLCHFSQNIYITDGVHVPTPPLFLAATA